MQTNYVNWHNTLYEFADAGLIPPAGYNERLGDEKMITRTLLSCTWVSLGKFREIGLS